MPDRWRRRPTFLPSLHAIQPEHFFSEGRVYGGGIAQDGAGGNDEAAGGMKLPPFLACGRCGSGACSDMDYEDIANDAQLRDYSRRLADAPSIAFDTEFVSEDSYSPVLCLVQTAAAGRLAVIDALAVGDMRPFWEAIVAEGRRIVVHAGRGELEFCLQATGRLPERLFDVQVAAGLTGIEYPAGFGALVHKILGQSSPKHETRTDWRRRPLSKRQIEYALDDAAHLHPMCEALEARLRELGRLEWLEEEMADWKEELHRAAGQERWRRVSGQTGLDARSLAVVRELWKWRDAEARRRDQPARRVLRDDLLVELARRQTADVKRIRAVRGMERGDLLRRAGGIAAAIQGRCRCRRSIAPCDRRGTRRRSSPFLGSSSLRPWGASVGRRGWRRIWWAGRTTFAS